MQNNPERPADFDIATVDGFLGELITVSYEEMSKILEGPRWERATSLARELYPIIFNVTACEASAVATRELIYLLTEGHPLETERRPIVIAKAWLLVFEEAFHRGLISPIAWGAAVTTIMTVRGDDDWPSWYTPHRLLGMLKRGDPRGRMTPDDRRYLAALPDTIALYRGGCTGAFTTDAALNELRQGIHWTPDHDTAEEYMRYRCEQRYQQPGCGLPAIIKAEVPKALILGCIVRGQHAEMLVDFERVSGAMVTDLNAASYPPGAQRRAA